MSRANDALDKMADNARELGLDHEPAQQEPVITARQLSLATRQWDHWKAYALELQERLVKYEGGAPMVLNNSTQPAQQQEPVALLQEIARLHDRIKALTLDVEFLSQPSQRKPLTPDQKQALAENWFAEDWAITKAIGMMIDHEQLLGIKENT